MNYLVTGGAGYIGSHIVKALIERGDDVTILDNFSTGHRWATQGQRIIEVDLRDLHALRSALSGETFDGVFHFAAKSLVAESNQQPLFYYQNNVAGTANLLEVAIENSWKHFVFSSSAAVYGNPETALIAEDHPTLPINVYGKTKLAMEDMMQDVCVAQEFSAISLRYFNAAGAALDCSLGESHEPETHLIPNALKAASGSGQPLTIFGDDYPTPDGTCIRDYIHVEDLANAHLKAMEYVLTHQGFEVFNLGNGQGFSVKDIFSACERATGKSIPHVLGERRKSDPTSLVADATKARKVLAWEPLHTKLDEIVASAWAWETK